MLDQKARNYNVIVRVNHDDEEEIKEEEFFFPLFSLTWNRAILRSPCCEDAEA